MSTMPDTEIKIY